MPPPSRLTGALRWMRRHPKLSVVGGLFFGTAVVASMMPPAPLTQPAPPQDLTIPGRVSSALAEPYVSPRLKDPSSAQYREVTYRLRRGRSTLCGEVNGRNGFGGYSGFQHFIAIGPIVEFERSEGHRAFRAEWHALCVLTDHDEAPKAATSNATGVDHGA